MTTTTHAKKPSAVLLLMVLVVMLLPLAATTSATGAIVNPTGISGLRLWLEANDLDGDGTAEGAGESYISGSTATWSDKSGNTNNFIQTNSASHASQTLGGLNGLATLSFSGSDHFIGPAAVLTAGDDSYTYLAVWNSTGLNGCCGSIYEQGSGGSRRASLLQVGGNYGFNGEANDAHIVSNTLNQWKISDLQIDNSVSPNVNIYNNGQLFSGNSGNPGALNVNDNGTTVGKKVNVNGEYFQGQIAEIIVYDKALSFQEHSDIGTYLNNKYNLGAAYPLVAPPEGLDALAHRWSFTTGANQLNDSVGTAHINFTNDSPTFSGDRVTLDGADFMATAPIDSSIGERTFVVWAANTNLSQPGGAGLLNLQTGSGGGTVFDSIVYQERTAGQWMNGSNFFQRTPVNNGGVAETSTDEIMLAIVYNTDNSIQIYREGVLYADYTQGSLITYAGGSARSVFGRRAFDFGPEFDGILNEARIYGDALTADDIALLYSLGPNQLAQLVPEPTSVMMLVLGVVGLACLLRNRRFHG